VALMLTCGYPGPLLSSERSEGREMDS
jgi:hypothetical protein